MRKGARAWWNEAYNVRRTMQTLELLAECPWTAPRLARELQIADPTARRILKRLAADGYAARENRPHGRYVVSARIVELGERAKRQIAADT